MNIDADRYNDLALRLDDEQRAYCHQQWVMAYGYALGRLDAAEVDSNNLPWEFANAYQLRAAEFRLMITVTVLSMRQAWSRFRTGEPIDDYRRRVEAADLIFLAPAPAGQ